MKNVEAQVTRISLEDYINKECIEKINDYENGKRILATDHFGKTGATVLFIMDQAILHLAVIGLVLIIWSIKNKIKK